MQNMPKRKQSTKPIAQNGALMIVQYNSDRPLKSSHNGKYK